MTTDKREAEITSPDSRLIEELRYLRGPDHTAACGVAAVKLIERLQRENELLFADRDQQDAEIDTLRQSLSAAEATIAAQAELAEKRRDEIEAAEARMKEMREALEGAEEWLDGWASAEPYLSIIRDALRAARASD